MLNAYFSMGHNPGGFRAWWRRLHDGSDGQLDNAHLIRFAGRFARRVKAWAAANGVPVIYCAAGQRKHLIAEEYLAAHAVGAGSVLDPGGEGAGQRWGGQPVGGRGAAEPGQEAGVRQSLQLPHHGHPGLGVPGHQDVRAPAVPRAGHPQRALRHAACPPRRPAGTGFTKEGNCFTRLADSRRLAQVADTLLAGCGYRAPGPGMRAVDYPLGVLVLRPGHCRAAGQRVPDPATPSTRPNTAVTCCSGPRADGGPG